MTNLTKITGTDTEYIVKGNLELTEDFKTDKNLIVKGNILGKDKERYNLRARNIYARGDIGARDIDAIMDIGARGDIYARDIYARDIICEERIKKYKGVKTMARIFIKNKSKLERKEWK